MPTSVRRAVVATVLVLACAACFVRLVLHPTDVLVGPQRGGENDLTSYFQPARELQLAAWQRFGTLPTWDSAIQLGRPLVGNPQSALYYPANWLCLVFGVGAISWLIVLHHLLAGWGTYLLCRRYGFAWGASLLGGVTFLAAPYLIAQSAEGHWAQIGIAAWMPWALLSYERLRRGRPRAVALMAVVLAVMFFCGHAQEVFYVVAILTIFLLVDAVRQRPDTLSSGKLLLHWAAAGALTIGLVAIDLLPTALVTRHATRGVSQLSAAQVSIANTDNLWQLLDPFVHGSPAAYWGPGNYWETLMHFGVAPLVFAAVAICFAWRTYPVGRFAALLTGGMIFALGNATPLYPVIHELLPGVGLFRVPSRMMFLCSLAVAVLAAAGVNHLFLLRESATQLQRRHWRIGLTVASGVAGCLFLLALVAGRSAASPAASSWQNVNLVFATGCLLLAFFGLLAATFAQARAHLVALTLVVVVCFELVPHAQGITRTIPPGGWRRESELTTFLSQQSGNFRVLVDQQLLGDDEARRHGILKVRGYEPFLLLTYAAAMKALPGERKLVSGELPGYRTFPPDSYRQEILDLLRVRYLVLASHEDVDASPWRLVARGKIPQRIALRGAVPRDEPYSVYESETPLPAAFVLGKTRPQGKGVQGIERLAKLDPRASVMVPHDELPPGPRQDLSAAEIMRYEPNVVTVKATLTQPGYLVLSDAMAPGWTAEADGQQHQVVPADFSFRGVPLAPGEHTVTFRFRPPGLTAGSLLTLGAICITVFLLFKPLLPALRKGPGAARHETGADDD